MKLSAKYKILNTKYIKKAASIALVLLVITGITTRLWPQSASAAWFDENFLYRQLVTLTVSSNASDIKNLETLITVDTSTLISAGKLQSSCQDLRFTSNTGKLLSYYIDSGCNTTTTKIWVMADTVPANTTSYVLYMYYGNPSALAGTDATKFTLFRGLVGYWGMNESAWNGTSGEVKDFSVNGNNGTSTNGAAITGSGKYASAGSFDGTNDYVEVADSNSLDLTSSFTISTWIKTSTTANKVIIEKSNNNTNYLMHTSVTAGKISFGFAINNTVDTLTSINDNSWHLVTGTFDDATNTLRIYVDGVLDNSMSTATGTLTANTTNLILGSRSGTVAFPGSLDDTRIYNRALSSSEISQLYSNPGTIASYTSANALPTTSFATEEKAPQPVAYWAFDEGTGTVANDGTSNKNNGTLTNMSSTPATNSGWMTDDMCISGKCLGFDGNDDYVTIPNSSSLNVQTGSFTLSAWIKKTGPSFSGDQYQTIIAKGYGGTYTYSMYVNTSNGIGFAVYDGTHAATINSTGTVTVGTWYHIEGVYDGTNLTIYINGKRDGTGGKNSFSGTTTTDPVEIGVWPNQHTGRGKFNGFIDEPKIYPYARSTAQIKADFASRGGSIGASGVLGAASNNNAALSNGLVGYWKMDEASWSGGTGEVKDSSGNGNNGTSTNASTTGGKFGNAGSFDGSTKYVNVPDTNVLSVNTTNQFAVSSWIYLPSLPSTTVLPISKGSGGNYEWSIRLNTSGTPSFWVETASGTTIMTITSSTSLSTSQWAHITGTVDLTNAQIKIYVNGVLTGTSTSSSGSYANGTAAVNFGRRADGGNYANVNLDETRIYNRALSPAEVATLYNFAPGPVGYWNLDEKSGTTASDISGNSNNGTWNGTGNHFTSGNVGGAGNFNGSNDVVSISDTSALDMPNNDITITAWIKTTAGSSAHSIVSKKTNAGSCSGATNTGYDLFMESSGVLSASICDGTTLAKYNYGSKNIKDGSWHFVAVTFERNSSLTVYKDGVSGGSLSISGLGSIANSNSFRVGSDGSYIWNGQIDDVKVYNYTRTQKQMIEDMNASHPVVTASGVRQGSSMVGYWDFDEGFGTTANDLSGNGNRGTLTNMASPATATSGWSNSGKFGKGLVYDGSNDYVSIADSSSLAVAGDITLSAWIKTTLTSQNVVIGGYNSASPYQGYGLGTSILTAGKVGFWSGSNPQWLESSRSVNDGNWHHILVSLSGTNASFYIDGKLDVVRTSAAVNSFSGPRAIGARSTGQIYFSGSVDEVKLYNYALTASDVKTDYNRGASQVLGSTGTSSTGVNDNSSDRMYCPPGDTTASCGPVGEWDFEEGQGSSVNDSSGNGNTGTWSGTGNTHWTTGKIGKAGGFNGTNDYVSISDSTSLNVSTNFTVSGWIKYNGGGVTPAIYDSGTQSGHWFIAVVGNKLDFTEAGIANNVASTSLDTNWHHFSVIKNGDSGTNLSIYLDGKLDGSFSVGTVAVPSGVKYIGQWTAGYSLWWPGNLDNIKVYNYARTPAQVAWDYNRGLPVAHWDMDECQGGVLNDLSGNGNTGTLVIGATGTQASAGTCQTSSTAWGNGVSGKKNSSLSFDGTDDYVTVPSAPTLQLTNSFTISTWMKSGNTSQASKYILGKANYYGLLYGYVAGKVEFYSGNYTGSDPRPGTTITISDTGWHHIVYSYDGTTLSGYKDGKRMFSNTISFTLGTTSSNLTIGTSDATHPGNDFLGQLDDLRFYNYGLTASQVDSLYNGGAINFAPSTGNP